MNIYSFNYGAYYVDVFRKDLWGTVAILFYYGSISVPMSHLKTAQCLVKKPWVYLTPTSLLRFLWGSWKQMSGWSSQSTSRGEDSPVSAHGSYRLLPTNSSIQH